MDKQKRPPPLHAINAMRVLAEFWIVRAHCLPSHAEFTDDPKRSFDSRSHIGIDIMGFFFVLSGFVVMYSYQDTKFDGLASKLGFVWSKIKRIYAVFLLHIFIALVGHVSHTIPSAGYCWVYYLCTCLQFIGMDGWFGCGWKFPPFGLAWYLTCLVWLWLLFPFMKAYLSRLFLESSFVWCKMIAIYFAWMAIFFMLWGYDMYTLAGVPVLRLGEFVLGCASACSLHVETPWILQKNRFWLPFILIIILYNFQETSYLPSFICLDERTEHGECTLWHSGQTKMQTTPPCVTVAEKIQNKYSLIYAGVLHGIARAELDGSDTVWFMSILSADIFKKLSTFSFTLYLSHVFAGKLIGILGWYVMHWKPSEWHDDTLMILIYVLAYNYHVLLERVLMPRKSSVVPPPDEIMVEQEELLVASPEDAQHSVI